MLPRLLVSVRSLSEAMAAVRGGVSILDIKDPSSGPLGRAAANIAAEITCAIRESGSGIPVSVALGEIIEWQGEFTSDQEAWRRLLSEACPVAFCKLGPSQLGDVESSDHPSLVLGQDKAFGLEVVDLAKDPLAAGPLARSTTRNSKLDEALGWEVVFRTVRERLTASPLPSGEKLQAPVSARLVDHFPDTSENFPTSFELPGGFGGVSGPSWIAVSYADWQRSRSPSPMQILQASVEQGYYGLLLDTWKKDGAGLLSWCSIRELSQLRAVTREYGMQLALAGQLTASDLNSLVDISPDIIAVRGAVCHHGLRTSEVSESLVRDFVSSIRQHHWA